LGGTVRERDHSEEPGIDGKLIHSIKMDVQEVEWSGMDWIDLAQDRDKLQGFVNAVINFQVP